MVNKNFGQSAYQILLSRQEKKNIWFCVFVIKAITQMTNRKRVSSFRSYWEHLCVCAVTNNFDISPNIIIILKALSITGSPALHQQPCCSLRHHVLTPCRSISYHNGNTTDMKNTLTVTINSTVNKLSKNHIHINYYDLSIDATR